MFLVLYSYTQTTAFLIINSYIQTMTKVTALVDDAGQFVLRLCTKFEVRRPSSSEDIGHLLCEH